MVTDTDDATALEYDPEANPPKDAKPWLNLIAHAEKVFQPWQDQSDKIDKAFANLEKLSAASRSREMQLLWANIQVLGPSIYARPPVPVVAPRFKDRRKLYQTAAEFLERSCVVAADRTLLDDTLKLARDDIIIPARGALWVRYESDYEGTGKKRACVEHLNRRDFLHDPARNWSEVGWVARKAHLTQKKMRKRFKRYSGDAYRNASYTVEKTDKDIGAQNPRATACVWEIWSKTESKVVWVTPGVDICLEEGDPHLKLDGFFPCPRPAYGTVQRGGLIPVPDPLFYKDQLEEINKLTERISALTEALRVKGFYAKGSEDVGDALQKALKSMDDRAIMVPVATVAALGSGMRDAVEWFPIEQVANTITALVALRKELIDDVYQITGISDIMRGTTEKDETLGAQQLKSQFGSVRIRDRQQEMSRLARDAIAIMAEIMAEYYDQDTLAEMSQLELESDAEVNKLMKQLEGKKRQIMTQAEQAMADPQMMQQAQQNPEAAQQLVQQVQQQIAQIDQQIKELDEIVTIEEVMELLRDQNIRPFVLQIETDSTIQPDEQAEKASRAEFLQVLTGVMHQGLPLVQQFPQAGKFVGESIKFAIAPYRAGRTMDQAIDDFVDQMEQMASQPQPNPEAEKAKADMEMQQQKLQADMQMKAKDQEIAQQKAQADMQVKQIDAQAKQAEADARMREIEAGAQRDQQKHSMDMQMAQMKLREMEMSMAASAQKAQIDVASAQQQAAIRQDEAAFKAEADQQRHQQEMQNGAGE